MWECPSFGEPCGELLGTASEEKLIHLFMLSAVVYETSRPITKNGSGT